MRYKPMTQTQRDAAALKREEKRARAEAERTPLFAAQAVRA